MVFRESGRWPLLLEIKDWDRLESFGFIISCQKTLKTNQVQSNSSYDRNQPIEDQNGTEFQQNNVQERKV